MLQNQSYPCQRRLHLERRLSRVSYLCEEAPCHINVSIHWVLVELPDPGKGSCYPRLTQAVLWHSCRGGACARVQMCITDIAGALICLHRHVVGIPLSLGDKKQVLR